jgi:hypothetical protein
VRLRAHRRALRARGLTSVSPSLALIGRFVSVSPNGAPRAVHHLFGRTNAYSIAERVLVTIFAR